MWTAKLIVCVLVDLFDFTIGRVLFALPLSGELVGVAVGCALFGKSGFWYALEIVDPTEQLDGFIPMATLIALAHRPNDTAIAA